MRKFTPILFAVAGVVIVWWAGHQLSQQALAMVIGLFMGLLAGVPLGLAMIILERAQQPARPKPAPQPELVRCIHCGQTYDATSGWWHHTCGAQVIILDGQQRLLP